MKNYSITEQDQDWLNEQTELWENEGGVTMPQIPVIDTDDLLADVLVGYPHFPSKQVRNYIVKLILNNGYKNSKALEIDPEDLLQTCHEIIGNTLKAGVKKEKKKLKMARRTIEEMLFFVRKHVAYIKFN